MYIFALLWSYRAHKAPRVCIIMCCGAVFAQNKPNAYFWHSARAHSISKCRMENTMRGNARPAAPAPWSVHLFISQYYCFRPSTRHQVAVKFAFCGVNSFVWRPKITPSAANFWRCSLEWILKFVCMSGKWNCLSNNHWNIRFWICLFSWRLH